MTAESVLIAYQSNSFVYQKWSKHDSEKAWEQG